MNPYDIKADTKGITLIDTMSGSHTKIDWESFRDNTKVVSPDITNGAYQNRLERTYNNNADYAENLQRAEAQIRDTDMAEEMMDYSKNNILKQVGQSMVAQANQQHDSVLSLLQ